MTIATDLVAAQAQLTADAAIMHAIVHGPASGPDSIVTTAGGEVKTLARVALELSSPLDAQGDWSGAVTYARGAFVSASDGSYVSRQDTNLNHTPVGDANPTWWLKVAGNGATGAAGSATSNSTLALTGVISPTTIAADQNDYAPAGIATASTLRLTCDADRTITGLAAGGTGEIKIIQNVNAIGGGSIRLASSSTASAAANRFGFPADVLLAPGQGITLRYDSSSTWLPTMRAPADPAAAVELVPPVAGMTGALITADGKQIAATYATTTSGSVPDQASVAYFARGGARGIKLEVVSSIRTAAYTTPYTPRYDGPFWLSAPTLSGGNLLTKINWDKRGTDWRDITIGPTSLSLTGGVAGDVVFIFATFGQSLGDGNAPAYTDTAPDAANLKMIANSNSFRHPYFAPGLSEAGLTALSHDAALSPQYGETHLASMGLTLLGRMQTAGQKIAGVYVTAALGGHSLRDLDEDSPPYLPQGRNATPYGNLMRLINYARQQILALGKVPVLAPLLFVHGEEDSWDYNQGDTAEQYAAGLIALRKRFNRDARRLFGWHALAPDLPMMVTQTRRTPNSMWTSAGAKVFRRGLDGPMLGQWAAAYLDPGIVMCGPNWQYPLQGDDSHLNGTGYFRFGEQIGRQLWNVMFGQGPGYFRPVAGIRQSDTVFDFVLQRPGGTTLVLDAVKIPDHPDGNKGLYAWREDTGAGVPIASVAVQAADTLRIIFAAAYDYTVPLWLDGGLWGDSRSYTAQQTLGPRLNLRTDQVYPSIISSYGGSAVDDYDWCPAFRVPVPGQSGSPRTWRYDGRL